MDSEGLPLATQRRRGHTDRRSPGGQPPATPIRSSSDEIVESAWWDQAVWSATAGKLKADLTRWRTRAAIAGVTGAILQTAAATLPATEELRGARASIALIGVAILAIVPYILGTKVTKVRITEWVRARSASEALKEQIFRFLVAVPPYDNDRSVLTLINETQAAKATVRDLNMYAADIRPAKRRRPTTLTIDGYAELRVNDQIDRFYQPKSRENSRVARRLHGVEFGLGVLAVGLGAIASGATAIGVPALGSLGSWVAVITAAGATVTTHLAASGYDRQSITYFATAERLKHLRDQWSADPEREAPERVARFVNECETAISSENEAWMSAWTRPDQQSDTPSHVAPDEGRSAQ